MHRRLFLAAALSGLLCRPALAADPLAEIAERINAERQRHGLPMLVSNEKLVKAAQSQADWMAQVRKMEHLRGQQPGSFEEWKRSHHHPVNRVIQAGYFEWHELYSLEVKDGQQVLIAKPGTPDRVGEIIAHGPPQSGPGRFQPKVIVAGWMNSPGHRQDVLNEHYRELGVGFTRTRQGDAFWCVVFGRK